MNSASFGIRGPGEGLWDWNLVSNRIHFSPGWLGLVGCDEHELGTTQQAWLQRVHPDDLPQVSQTIDASLTDGPDTFEFRHRMLHKDGSYRWMSCRGVVQRNPKGRAVRVSGCHADVTAEAVSDTLTGLPNQLLLVERLTRSIARAARYPGFHFAVLSIGVERPEGLEGTPTRDPLLSAAARRLETCLRVRETPPTLRNDDLVARLDGDHFAILLDGLKEIGHATIAADRILAALLTPYAVSGRELRLSASIGIAVSPTGYTSADEVLRDADTALHRAELLGGKRCEVFDTAVLQLATAELRLEADLEGALERDEFELFYQPIVSLASNQIVGFEALVRWQHPVLGMILPLEFVPIAEKTGAIVPLGQWVLREACQQLKAWQGSSPLAENLWVSVNLSGVQLKHPALLEEIAEVLRESGLEPRSLLLELTEGMAMENPAAARTLLMQIRALGARVSVDDFGTGHSALAYLRQFPLDSLKVDRSFVRGIEANPDMASILGAVTTMTRQLGLQMVAEGIEKGEQLELIRKLDCEFGQGFLFSKPVDRDRATALLDAGLPLWPADAATSQSERSEGRQRLWTTRGVLAAAAVLTVLVSVGLPRYLTQEPPLESPAVLETPQNGDVQLDVAGVAGEPEPVFRPEAERVVTPVPSPPRSVGSARVVEPEPKVTAVPAPIAPVAVGPVPPAPAPAPAAPARVPAASSSLRVVHQHRLGNCAGLLVVSRDGVTFVPDESDDGFTLLYHQFLDVMDGDSLTIRSADKAYRFLAGGGAASADQLGALVHAITRFRKNGV